MQAPLASQDRQLPPLRVTVMRGDAVESVHAVIAVVCNAQGECLRAWGNPEQLVMPRSSIKPLQAIPLVETGAAEAYSVLDAELAMACSSHRGMLEHVTIVHRWLTRLGLEIDDLACGAHVPRHEATLHHLIKTGVMPSAIHNNCSGKHLGFLTTALHMQEPIQGYNLLDHPCQQRVNSALAEMCMVDFAHLPCGIDGCSIPAFALPLRSLALGMAQFASPERLSLDRAAAITRLQVAMARNPFLVDGPDRLTTDLIATSSGAVLPKSGAEGVYAVSALEAGLGVALKVLDGHARAAEVALGAVLDSVGLLKENDKKRLNKYLQPTITNCNGTEVGKILLGLDQP